MKFRLKGEAFPKPVLTIFENDSVTVRELKVRVGEIMEIEDQELLESIQLSMNGKVSIATEDSQSLTSLGFVSGDTVYVLGVSVEATACKRLKQVSGQSSEQEKPSLSTEEKQDVDSKVTYMSSLSDSADTFHECYSHLASTNPEKLKTPLEQVAGLLHIFMVDTGFLAETSKSLDDPYTCLPDSWNVQHGSLQLHYKTRLPPHSPCTIAITSVGPLIIVHGIESKGKSRLLKIKSSEISPSSANGNLKQLSLDFKNTIAYPLLVSIQREANGLCPANFSNLPPEILNSIFRRLDVRSLCRLSTTCSLFKDLTNQPMLWKRLVVRDFRRKITGGVPQGTIDWKKFYKDEYILERKQREVTSRIRSYPMVPTLPPPLFPTYPAYPEGIPEFPGMIGGYSDLYPDLRAFGPPGRRLPFPQGPQRPQGFFPRPFGGHGRNSPFY